MMPALRRIIDHVRYDRLKRYPALSRFDREEAYKRLRIYAREERKAHRPWYMAMWATLIVSVLPVFLLLQFKLRWVPVIPIFCHIVGVFLSIIIAFVLERRLRRRIEARVAAELRDGRLWTCLSCGYDLRASNEQCPECGASVHVRPPDANRDEQ